MSCMKKILVIKYIQITYNLNILTECKHRIQNIIQQVGLILLLNENINKFVLRLNNTITIIYTIHLVLYSYNFVSN